MNEWVNVMQKPKPLPVFLGKKAFFHQLYYGPHSPKGICIIVVVLCNIYIFFIFIYSVGLYFYIFTDLLLGPCWHDSVTCCESTL